MKNCLMCDKDVSRFYMLRDPFKAEERSLAKQTLLNAKEKALKKSKLSQNEEESIMSVSGNKSFSAVKPVRLDFIE